MLFDLRGGGRRRTIQAIYLTLAILMGGGLILFGVGGNVSGGLIDAISNNSGSSSASDTNKKRIETLEKRVAANPNDAAAYADLARTRANLVLPANDKKYVNDSGLTADGRAMLNASAAAWEKYLTLKKTNPDDGIAVTMAQVYAALDKLDKVVESREIVVDARPAYGTYSQLAVAAYMAKQNRKGDLAAEKAVALAPKDQRESLKSQLDQAKQQIAQGQQTTPANTNLTPGAG